MSGRVGGNAGGKLMDDEVTRRDGHGRAGVLIADADRRVRQALRALLETDATLTIVGETGSARELVIRARALEPRVVVLDLLLPDAKDGIDAIRLLAESGCRSIIVLSAAAQWRKTALEAGATVFLDKGMNADLILTTVSDAASSMRQRISPDGQNRRG